MKRSGQELWPFVSVFPRIIKNETNQTKPKKSVFPHLLFKHVSCAASVARTSVSLWNATSNPCVFWEKKLQWLEVENVDTASLTHTHSQTVKSPTRLLTGTCAVPSATVQWRWARDPGSIFLLSSKGQAAFYNTAPQLNPGPPLPNLSSHSAPPRQES